MFMRLKYLFIPILINSLFYFGCETRLKPATGLENEIIVVADSVEFEELKSSLELVFEREIETPQPEKIFELKRINYSELQRYRTRKNLVFISSFNSETDVATFIKNSLDSTSRQQILTGETSFILKKNLWAKDQLVLLITAPKLDELEFELVKNGEKFVFAFQKASDARLLQSIYNPYYEQKNIEAKLLKNYGWMIYVQADFVLAVDKPEDNFVWIRRSPNTDMERWVFVYWINDASPAMLHKDTITAIRNSLTEKYYRTSDEKAFVEIADLAFNTTEINFNNRYAIYSQGLWRTTDKFMGGPFVSYTFYDEKTRRLYMIDGSIYAPKYYKRNLIQQVDVVLQSFLTEAELTPERKESILDELEE